MKDESNSAFILQVSSFLSVLCVSVVGFLSTMKRTALALLLLTLAPLLFAETIRFDPPGATTHRSVDAIVSGVWPNSCVPSVKNVVDDGSTAVLHLNATPPFGVLCSQLVRPY